MRQQLTEDTQTLSGRVSWKYQQEIKREEKTARTQRWVKDFDFSNSKNNSSTKQLSAMVILQLQELGQNSDFYSNEGRFLFIV